MADFSVDELRRMQTSLRKRFRINNRENLVDVGFGTALKDGKLQPERGICVTFFVRKKKNPRSKNDRLPSQVSVRLKRGKRFVTFDFHTDVVQVSDIVATGKRLDYRSKYVTTGAIVAWKGVSSSRLSWGVVTVGHSFPPLGGLSQSRRKVSIRTRRGRVPGTLVAKSNRNKKIDAAIALVEKEDLLSKRLLKDSQTSREIKPRKLEKLYADRTKVGQTLRIGGKRKFEVHAYLPSLKVTGIGTVIHIVSVVSTRIKTFKKGTSGSSWLIQNQAACIQVAGRSPEYCQGFGQSLETVTQWAEKKLEAQKLMKAGSFRMVLTF